MLVELISIASVIDTDTLMVYACYQAGGHDPDSGRHISKLSRDWFKGMDEWDQSAVKCITEVNAKNIRTLTTL